jgi:hypothetical protein
MSVQIVDGIWRRAQESGQTQCWLIRQPEPRDQDVVFRPWVVRSHSNEAADECSCPWARSFLVIAVEQRIQAGFGGGPEARYQVDEGMLGAVRMIEQ